MTNYNHSDPPILNEIQLQRLLRKKSNLSAKLVRQLHESLLEISKTQRFQMIKGLKVSYFKSDGQTVTGPVENLTIEELVDHGALRICGLPSMGGKRINTLIKVLKTVTPEQALPTQISQTVSEGQDPPSRPKVTQPRQRLSPNGEITSPRFISTRSWETLTQTLDKLRSSERLSQVGTRKVKEYWPPNSVRAPFEESLTLHQIAEIDQEQLLRKRSLSENKVKALTAAIDAVLTPQQTSNEQRPRSRSTEKKAQSSGDLINLFGSNNSVKVSWNRDESLELVEDILITGVEVRLTELAQNRTILGEISQHIPDYFTSSEALMWLFPELSPDLCQLKDKIDGSYLNTQCYAMLSNLPSGELFIQTLKNTLKGVGSYLEPALQPFLTVQASRKLQLTLGRTILLSLGAQEWRYEQFSLDNFFTRDPQRLIEVVRTLCRLMPLKSSELTEQCSFLLPHLEFSQLLPIFESMARFDSEKDCWEFGSI